MKYSIGEYIGITKGGTRSLDYSSYTKNWGIW